MSGKVASNKKNKTNKAWVHEHINDSYVQRARAGGLRSRAAFKLSEDRVESLIDLLGNFGIVEMVRTGQVSMTRGVNDGVRRVQQGAVGSGERLDMLK